MSALLKMKKNETTFFYRRNLPHWSVKDPLYFVTFRLKNTIPQKIFDNIRKEYEESVKLSEKHEELKQIQRVYFKKIESILDQCDNSNDYLVKPEIALIITEAFQWIEDKHKWKVISYVIMPNHVHCLLYGGKANQPLEKSLKTFKGFTAREANKILSRKGSFWAPESFDRWCRDLEEEKKIKKYIRNNPVKAGLVKRPEDWPWTK